MLPWKSAFKPNQVIRRNERRVVWWWECHLVNIAGPMWRLIAGRLPCGGAAFLLKLIHFKLFNVQVLHCIYEHWSHTSSPYPHSICTPAPAPRPSCTFFELLSVLKHKLNKTKNGSSMYLADDGAKDLVIICDYVYFSHKNERTQDCFLSPKRGGAMV